MIVPFILEALKMTNQLSSEIPFAKTIFEQDIPNDIQYLPLYIKKYKVKTPIGRDMYIIAGIDAFDKYNTPSNYEEYEPRARAIPPKERERLIFLQRQYINSSFKKEIGEELMEFIGALYDRAK